MVDGIRTLFLEEARQFVGKDVVLEIHDGGGQSHAERAKVEMVTYVRRKGPCFVTDRGDFAVDHVLDAKAA